MIKRTLLPSPERCAEKGITRDERRRLRNKLKARRKAHRNYVPPQATDDAG